MAFPCCDAQTKGLSVAGSGWVLFAGFTTGGALLFLFVMDFFAERGRGGTVEDCTVSICSYALFLLRFVRLDQTCRTTQRVDAERQLRSCWRFFGWLPSATVCVIESLVCAASKVSVKEACILLC